MKRKIIALSGILMLVLVNITNAQDGGTLTNTTIIRMVKAKLADDLIIDEIKNSRVDFNLSADSLLALQNENVSVKVIQAMRDASPSAGSGTIPTTTPVAQNKAVAESQGISQPVAAQPQDIPEKSATVKETETVAIKAEKPDSPATNPSAVGYVIPLKELITFYSGEFTSIAGLIGSWDQKVRAALDDGNKKMENIRQREKELFDKINADSRSFSDEIKKLKDNLSDQRGSYMEFEDDMIENGLNMIRELESAVKEINRSINSKFNEVSQAVKKSDADLSLEGKTESFIIPRQEINESTTSYVAPVNQLLFFCRNEISEIQVLISNWNEKVISAIGEDKALKEKLDPLLAELNSLQSDQKTNRKRISELKDQCSELEKERKRLGQSIRKDSSDLAKNLDGRCKDVLGSLEERLTDIAENIRYMYQDNFTYRSI